MMNPFIRKAILVFTLVGITHFIHGQKTPSGDAIVSVSSAAKPYKVLTNGKQITIQSKQTLKSLMVWTSGGHRIVEEKELKTVSYSFTVPSSDKVFFIMIETAEGKRFTEKMGVK
jgi:hypothetical protein